METDLELYSIVPAVVWNSGWEVLGAEYGASVSVFDGNLDPVHAIGAELGYALPKLGMALTTKYLHEVHAESRFRGHVVSLAVAVHL